MDSSLFRFLLLLFLINLIFQLVHRLREPTVDPFYNALLAVDAFLCGYGFVSLENLYSIWALLGVLIFVGAVLIPGILGIFTRAAVTRTRWKLALRFAQARHLFAPTQDSRMQMEHIAQLEKAHLGNITDLERDLAAEITRAPEPQHTFLQETLIELFAFSGQWERCLETFARLQSDPDNMEISRPTLAVALIRASLETRDAARAWKFYQELRRFEPSDPTVVSALLSAEVMMLAFYGASEALEQALYPPHRPHPIFSVSAKRYWLGIAHLQQGDMEKASKYLDFPKKLEEENPVLGKLARQHIQEGSVPVAMLSVAQETELQRMAKRVPQLFLQIQGPKPPIATGLFLMCMFAAFVTQILLGSPDDIWTLYRLGANVRTLALHEPVRLVLAMFLHAGFLHLLLNGLMLFMFGRMLENHFGFLRTFSVFVFSGICGNAASAVIYRQGISVGASSAVFGMLGATLMLFVIARELWHPLFRKKQIYNLVFLLVLNLILGLSMPMIDNAAHVGGFLGGSFLGWFFLVIGAKTKLRRNIVRILGIGALLLTAISIIQSPVFAKVNRMREVSWTQNGYRIYLHTPIFWEQHKETLQNFVCQVMPTFSIFFVPRSESKPLVENADIIQHFLHSYTAQQKHYRIQEKSRRTQPGFDIVVNFVFHLQGRPGMESMFLRVTPEGVWALRFVYDSRCTASVVPFMDRIASSFRFEPFN